GQGHHKARGSVVYPAAKAHADQDGAVAGVGAAPEGLVVVEGTVCDRGRFDVIQGPTESGADEAEGAGTRRIGAANRLVAAERISAGNTPPLVAGEGTAVGETY